MGFQSYQIPLEAITSKFVGLLFFSSIANVWLSVKQVMQRLCEPNERRNMDRKKFRLVFFRFVV